MMRAWSDERKFGSGACQSRISSHEERSNLAWMVSVRQGIGSVMVIELDTCCRAQVGAATSLNDKFREGGQRPPDCSSAGAASGQPGEQPTALPLQHECVRRTVEPCGPSKLAAGR